MLRNISVRWKSCSIKFVNSKILQFLAPKNINASRIHWNSHKYNKKIKIHSNLNLLNFLHINVIDSIRNSMSSALNWVPSNFLRLFGNFALSWHLKYTNKKSYLKKCWERNFVFIFLCIGKLEPFFRRRSWCTSHPFQDLSLLN